MTVASVGDNEGVAVLSSGLAKLREPFPVETVGKLPRITCPSCSKKECREHTKKRCGECGGFMTPAHIHIDYVGHAPVTDRLLSVDPHWTWEPFAIGADGLPAVVKNERGVPVGLWIRLTVLGITRPGYGSTEPKPEAMKELIGDALRNAAMRFGVALDLWSKTDLESARAELESASDDAPEQTAAPKRSGGEALARARAAVRPSAPKTPPLPERPAEPEPPPPPAAAVPSPAAVKAGGMSPAQNRMLHALLNGKGMSGDEDRHKFAADTLGRAVESMTELSSGDASKVIDALKNAPAIGTDDPGREF